MKRIQTDPKTSKARGKRRVTLAAVSTSKPSRTETRVESAFPTDHSINYVQYYPNFAADKIHAYASEKGTTSFPPSEPYQTRTGLKEPQSQMTYWGTPWPPLGSFPQQQSWFAPQLAFTQPYFQPHHEYHYPYHHDNRFPHTYPQGMFHGSQPRLPTPLYHTVPFASFVTQRQETSSLFPFPPSLPEVPQSDSQAVGNQARKHDNSSTATNDEESGLKMQMPSSSDEKSSLQNVNGKRDLVAETTTGLRAVKRRKDKADRNACLSSGPFEAMSLGNRVPSNPATSGPEPPSSKNKTKKTKSERSTEPNEEDLDKQEKLARARLRARSRKDRYDNLKEKEPSQLTDEETVFVKKYEDYKQRKRLLSKKGYDQMKKNRNEILSKPASERTGSESNFLQQILAKKQSKNRNDRIRQKKKREMVRKKKNSKSATKYNNNDNVVVNKASSKISDVVDGSNKNINVKRNSSP